MAANPHEMEMVERLMAPDGRTIDLADIPPFQRITVDMVDTAPDFIPVYLQAVPLTMTSAQNMFALYSAVRYLAQARIAGDIVECGVWRGGSCVVAALALQACGDTQRDFWLYDTFSGMPEPTGFDQPIGVGRTVVKHDPKKIWDSQRIDDTQSRWCHATLDDVQHNMRATGYPPERVHYVQGKVEETLLGKRPRSIACLRLDTDWYESTRDELEHLFPLLVPGGVLILDDYGFWAGQKKAVDEYFAAHGITLLLQRIDANARLAIKTV